MAGVKRSGFGYFAKIQPEGLNMACETEKSRMTPRNWPE